MASDASSLSLELKPDFHAAQQRWLAFWAHELLDRPCCVMRAPKQGAPTAPAPPYMAGAREDFGPVIEQILAWARSVYWGGDAIPCYSPSFGPDQMAAWLGAELHFPAQSFGTNWVVPSIDDWQEALPITLDPNNYWWRRMLDFCAALAQAFAGKMLVAHVDLHSNLDALAALRGPQRLCLDLIEQPEIIDRAMQQVRALYVPIYDSIYQAGQMAGQGTLGWLPAYHPQRTNTIQCDFAALIGPAHFRRWALPALEEEAAYLGHCVFHLDGPECLVHLDDLCAVAGIDCIQWVPGARNEPFMRWLDLLKHIQAKGLSVWVPCNTEELKIYHRELKPNLVCYDCWAPSQQAAEEALEWLVRNT
jgi:hypothetical protein